MSERLSTQDFETIMRSHDVFSHLVEALVEFTPVHSRPEHGWGIRTLTTNNYRAGEQGDGYAVSMNVRQISRHREVTPLPTDPIITTHIDEEAFTIPTHLSVNTPSGLEIDTQRFVESMRRQTQLGAEVTGWALHILADVHRPPTTEPASARAA